MTTDKTSVPNVRCTECQELGVECPKGYYAGLATCNVCGHEIALLRAQCIEKWPECPKCGHGEMDPPEDDDDGK